MAVRFDANNEELKANLALGSISQLTITMWVKISVDRNAYGTFWQVDPGIAGDLINVGPDTDGTSVIENDELAINTTGVAMTVGTWYFIGTSINAGAGTLIVRAISAASSTVRTWSGGSTSITATWLRVGNDLTGLWFNGCVAAVKVWSGATLTQAELENEMWSYTPRRAANLKAWYPLLKTETQDYSGNGYTLTGGVGATTEDGPAIGWGWTRTQPPIKDTIEIGVGQATSTETAGTIIPRHTVNMAVETSTARSTVIETIVDTVTEINHAAEIVDPIAIGVTPLTASSAAASAQSWSTASVAPTGNRLVLLCVSWAASTAVVANPIASVTGNGLTWALLRGQNYGAATGTVNARHRMEVWRALGPAPTAGAITITHAAAQPGINRCWSVFEVNSTDLSGTSGSGAIRQNAVNLGTAVTTATATLGAFGSAFNATVGFGAGGSAMSIGTGFTAIATQIVSTPAPATSLITEWFLGTDTTVNANQTTATQFGIIGFEIKRRFVEPLTGPPFETDLAQAITRRKTKTLGIATQTNAGQAVTARKTKAFVLATETDAAQVVVRPPKIGAVGQVSGTHTAQSVTARKTVAVGQVLLTNAAQAVTRGKLRAIGQALSSETARAVSALKAKLVGQATATDTARTVTSLKLKALGQASLTNAAQALTRLKTRAVGIATGAHAAQAIGRLKTLAVARSTETGTAQALTRVRRRAIGQATSTMAAQALTPLKTKALGIATGAHLAQALTSLRTLAAGRVSETETARVLTAVYVKALSRATETDTAQALTTAKALLLSRSSETTVAQALSRLKTLALGMATSTDLARIVGRARGIAQAVSTETSRALTAVRTLGLVQATETALARSIGRVLTLGQAVSLELARVLGLERGIIQVIEPNHAGDITSQPALSAAVGRVSGTDAAQAVTFVFTKVVALGQVTITNTAQGLTPVRLVPITLAVESNTAQTIRRLQVEQATETDTALTVVFSLPGSVVLTSAASGTARLRVEQAGAVLSVNPVASVQTSVEQTGVGLTIERLGGVQLSEET